MQISLANFEGPIDLLLFLVQKNEMDIKSIRLLEITTQYLDIISSLDDDRIEVASDFLVVAATLMYIKSKSLLPDGDEAQNKPEDVQELQEDLIKKIQEYQTYKVLSQEIFKLPWKNRDFFMRTPPPVEVIREKAWLPIELSSLVDCYQRSLAQSRRVLTLVKREYKSIAQKVSELAPVLMKDPTSEFSAVLPAEPDHREIVITFIALLELSRLKVVELEQDDPLGAIKIRLIGDIESLNLNALTGFDQQQEDLLKSIEKSNPEKQTQTNEQAAVQDENNEVIHG